MKLKGLFLFLLIASFPLLGKAQTYAGGSLSILDYSGTSYVKIAPEVGYNFNDKWAFGGKLGYYNYDGEDAFSISPYARFTFFRKGIFSMYADAGVELYLADSDTYCGVGITPGLAVRATDHISFFAKYGFLGYNNTPLTKSTGINLDTNNISLGFYYNF